MNTKNLVSVIIPTHGTAVFLERAINSVLRQTYGNIEVIVVDDNNDGDNAQIKTECLLSKYKDDRIKYIKNGKNMERSFSRNNGVKHSTGNYLMFLDNDDEFMPEKIEKQIHRMLATDDTYTFSYCSYIRKSGNKIVCVNGEKREGNLLIDALSRNLFVHAGSNLLVLRSSFESIDGFNEDINTNEDIDLLVRLFNTGNKIAYTDYLGLVVYLHDIKNKGHEVIKATPKFFTIEQNIINGLTEDEKIIVKKMIGLQLFRVSSLFDFKYKFYICQNYGINLVDIAKYVLYLAERFLKKKAFGIDLKSFL